jgi:lactate dehydrogenase-like 2-hydroxyacid dehydrogenase
MNITVLNTQSQELFSTKDFLDLREHSLKLLSLPQPTPPTEDALSEIPPETTCLLSDLTFKLTEAGLTQLPRLEYIGLSYTGWWDMYFDTAALKKRGIVLTNNPDYATQSVAEACFRELLTALRPLPAEGEGVPLGSELAGKVLGIKGLGKIGSRVAQIGRAFGMRVLSDSSRATDDVERVSFERLLAQSDVLGVYTPKSGGILLGPSELAMLKPDVHLLNPAGEEMFSTPEIIDFLRRNPSASYHYLAKPSPTYARSFAGLANAYIRPLYSNYTSEARQRRIASCLSDVQAFIEGREPRNRVL